ncbi:MAG: ribosome silencing factor [Elsteraceae bacterium]
MANMTSDELVTLVEESIEADKGEGVVVIPLRGLTSIADHMVIASGRSSRQVAAMAQHIASKLKESGMKRVAVEGLPRADWVLIDGGDIIIHLFRPEVRAFYNLEKMWGVEIPASAIATTDTFEP